MANYAKIVIKWTGISDIDSGFYIRMVDSPSIDVLFPWECKTVRINPFQFGQSEVNAVDQAGYGFEAIQADVANSSISGFINVTRPNSDEVAIEANIYGWAFTVESTPGTSNTTITETPEVLPGKDFQLTGYTLGAAASSCNDIELTITENGDGVAPYTWISPSNLSTTLSADISRQATAQTITVTIADSETDQASLANVVLPPLFNSSFISSISVVTNSGGFDATVTIYMTNPDDIFNYSYSLNGSDFQSSSIFPNVVDGVYTIYILDGYGCIASQGFTVDTTASVARNNPFDFVSKANSFRYIKRTASLYKTLENTLYQNINYLGEHKPFFAMPYNRSDGIITTQIKTNYDTISAKVVGCTGAGPEGATAFPYIFPFIFPAEALQTIQTETIVKKSDNIGQRDKRDCIAFNRGNNQAGLIFTTGNIYDPDTDVITDTYTLNGQLPDWAVVGNTVILTGIVTGSFVIKQIIFDSTQNANAVIFDYPWQDAAQSGAAISDVTYNSQPYEVYEFDTDLATLETGIYSIQITMADTLMEYPDVVYDSEYFNMADDHLRTNFIEYYNSPNTGLDYSTGILGRLRLRSLDAYASLTPGGEVTAYNDSLNNTTKLKDVPTMEGVFFIESQSRYMIEKLRIVFSHERYFINGEEWQNEDNIEVQNFDKAALKNATITLRRVDYETNKIDNVVIDADFGFILQHEGNLLQ